MHTEMIELPETANFMGRWVYSSVNWSLDVSLQFQAILSTAFASHRSLYTGGFLDKLMLKSGCNTLRSPQNMDTRDEDGVS